MVLTKDADVLGYQEYSRLDLLCGFTTKYPHFPCKICGKIECRGNEEKCKGFGAYSLGMSTL